MGAKQTERNNAGQYVTAPEIVSSFSTAPSGLCLLGKWMQQLVSM